MDYDYRSKLCASRSQVPSVALLVALLGGLAFATHGTAQPAVERPKRSPAPVNASNVTGGDWRKVDVTEAFPGSLADLENASAVNGGASGTGTGNKGNFSVNKKGQMAITFVQGTQHAGDVVVGRSDDGKAWSRHRLSDVDMRNSWFMAGNNVEVALTFVYTGPGPQVQIDDAGNVCLAYLSGDVLATAIWPADGGPLHPAERIVADIPVERCGLTKLDRQIAWFQLHQHGGRFYLVTTPDSAFADFVRVYELVDRKWRQLGESITAVRGALAWDDVTGELYLGAECYRKNVNGHFPSVFRWDPPSRAWQELQSPAAGLRDAFGVTSYPGGGCPTLVAHKGEVWAFWWQEADSRLQAAQFHDGRWVSCAKTLMTEWDQEIGRRDVERESFGQGHGIYQTTSVGDRDSVWMDAFRDVVTGDLVVMVAGCKIGLVIHEGRTYSMEMRGLRASNKELSGELEKGPKPKERPVMVAEVGQGFDNMVSSSAMMPHTVRSTYVEGKFYVQATLNKGSGSASDVFVYRISPQP